MRSSTFIAIFDACVLYPAPLRDLLVRLAVAGCFRARWSADIHDEWVRNLLANRTDIEPAQLQRTVQLMNDAVEDCLVADYELLIDGLTGLPDANDRHVLAAAIRCNASVIVTSNLKDFPAEILACWGIEVQHPDEFIECIFDLYPALVLEAVREMRIALKKPPIEIDALFVMLAKVGLAQTVKSLEGYKSML